MKRWRIEILCVAVAVCAWLAYALVESRVANWASAHWGAAILRVTEGNVADAASFLQHRAHDAAILLSLALGLVIAQRRLARWFLPTTSSRERRWIAHAAVGFVVLNVWLGVAMHFASFWGLLWTGREDTTPLARFNLKYHLLREFPAAHKAVILGSSQARAQIEERQLNDEFGPRLQTGELHFPGSRAYDIMLVHRRLDPAAAQVVICYVSEMNFYGGDPNEAVPFFFGFAELLDAGAPGVVTYVPTRKLGYGLLGDALPAFYLRDALAQKILGTGVTGIRQKQQDQTARADLDGNAIRVAPSYRVDGMSDFQKRAFETFAANCARRRQTLVLIAGQLNPRLGSRIDPAVRADMLAFLRGLRNRSSNVVLIEDCPTQPASVYEDLTHVNKQTQEQFTRFLAARLQTVLPETARAN